MSESLLLLLSDTRFAAGSSPNSASRSGGHSGGIEAACAAGVVSDLPSLKAFLFGRLSTTGVIGAYAAAAVCARAGTLPDSMWRGMEAEIDARMSAPAARRASRAQGGDVFRMALSLARSPIFDALGRATIAYSQQPHHAVALGAIGAVAGARPEDAATAAAVASVDGPAAAAQQLLGLDPDQVEAVQAGIKVEIEALAEHAAAATHRPLSLMPSFAAPALEFLVEAHLERPQRVFAS
ncbi:MAG: hypothetical protein JO337_06035 [Acidimicrobiales bacterium]|nr:hypothetical protein [Acidimicrobiales bacterium]